MYILIIGIISAIIFIIILLIWNKYYGNRSIVKIVKKYFRGEQKKEAIDKYKEISKIVEETEKEMEKSIQEKTKLAKSQFEKAERELIQNGNKQYTQFSASLSSAMPETEEERKQDIKDLEGAISFLESLDKVAVKTAEKKVGVGLGMFYDKMSRKFKKIIEEKNLDQFDFIPVPRLKYHAFKEIKNIKDDDFLPILNIMIETNLLKDLIEINPAFHIILFTEKDLNLTDTEKVVLSFAYEEVNLTKKKLIELTEWDRDYAEEILQGLVKKGIIHLNTNINIESFNPLEERVKWKQLIEDIIRQNQQKEEEKFQNSIRRRQQLKDKLRKSKERSEQKERVKKETTGKQRESKVEKIKFGEKPSTKPLPSTKTEDKEKDIQEIKDKDSLIGAMEALDQELKTSQANSQISKEEKNLSEVSLDIDNIGEEKQNLDDLISSLILNYDEKFSLVNGGFVQYEKIKNYIIEKEERITEDLIKKMLVQLKNLHMINKSIEIGDFTFYTFNKIKLEKTHKEFIQFLINKKPMSKREIIEGLEWDEEKVLETMKSLQEKNILRLEDNKVMIPGAIQKE